MATALTRPMMAHHGAPRSRVPPVAAAAPLIPQTSTQALSRRRTLRMVLGGVTGLALLPVGLARAEDSDTDVGVLEETVLPQIEEGIANLTDSEAAQAAQSEVEALESQLTSADEKEQEGVLEQAVDGIKEQLDALKGVLGL